MNAPPEKRSAPAGNRGAGKEIAFGGQSNRPNYRTKDPFKSTRPDISHPNSSNLISVSEACQRANEMPATMLGWIVHNGIGKHVKVGRFGVWMINSDALQRLLAERAAA